MASSSTPAPQLLYSCIAHHTTILTEHTTSPQSRAATYAALALPEIPHTTSNKQTFEIQDVQIHYLADADAPSTSPSSPSGPGLSYIVVTHASEPRTRVLAFTYLTQLKTSFLAAHPSSSTPFATLPAYGAASFNASLRQLLISHNSGAATPDALASVQKDIQNVRGIMTQNIERVLERGERIDLLVDKTDRLGGSARDFRVRSRGLQRKLWWKNVRLMVLLVVVLVFLGYLLVGAGCGLPAWSNCVHHG